MYGKRATWDIIRELAFDDLLAAYVAVGGVTTKATRVVKFTNNTNETVYFTDVTTPANDGSDDKLKLPSNSYQLWDVTTNRAMSDLPQFIEVGTQFSCRHIAGSSPISGWVSVEILIVESGS